MRSQASIVTDAFAGSITLARFPQPKASNSIVAVFSLAPLAIQQQSGLKLFFPFAQVAKESTATGAIAGLLTLGRFPQQKALNSIVAVLPLAPWAMLKHILHQSYLFLHCPRSQDKYNHCAVADFVLTELWRCR